MTRTRFNADKWHQVFTDAKENNLSPNEVAVKYGKNINTVLNAEKSIGACLVRKKPLCIFSGIEWLTFLEGAMKENMTVRELSFQLGVAPSVIYAAERRTGLFLKRVKKRNDKF